MSIFKSFIGNKDIKWWDGLTRTFTRLTSTGATLALNKIGSVVDVLEVYGSGTNYTALTINDALANVSSNACTFLFQPGAWTIDANVIIPANVTLLIPKGAIFTVSNGITLTINSTIDAGSYIIFAGTGTIAGTPTLRVKDPTWFTGTETNNLYPSNPYTTWGSASPEGAITAPVGSIYVRTTAGAGTTRYYKESGTGNTGWIDGAHIGANAIWHAGNDGAGSGLDADTVDGRNPGSPSGIATLSAASKVVQPALQADTLYDGVTYRSANATPAANIVPVSGSNNGLDPGFDSNRPAFGVYSNNTQPGLTSGAVVKVAFNTEDYDSNANFDTANNRFTPTVAGKYVFSGAVLVTADSGSLTSLQIKMSKNGSVYKNLSILSSLSIVSGLNLQMPFADQENANGTTDYFEIFVFAETSSGTWSIGSTRASVHWEGCRIGS